MQNTFLSPQQKDVCQLRLDFKDFNLAQPMVGIMPDQGKCVTDMMTITGAQNLERFGLCGNATGQHGKQICPFLCQFLLILVGLAGGGNLFGAKACVAFSSR